MADTRELKIVINADSSDAKKEFGGLSGSIVKAQIAFESIKYAVGKARDAINNSVRASEQYRQALSALDAVAVGFGLNQKEANDAAIKLAKDGLLTVSEAALSLRNLFSSGLDIETSIALMDTLKNSAAANRKTSMSLADQIITTTEGIKNQNSVLTDNSGISTNYNKIVRDTAQRLGVQESALDDVSKAYAVANGFIREGSIFSGFAARESEKLSGKQAVLASQTTELKTKIGQALTPAVINLAGSFGDVLADAIQFVDRNMQVLQRTFVLLATIGRTAINVLTLQFQEAKESAQGYWDYVVKQTQDSADEQISTITNLNQKIEEVNTSTAKKINESIAEENKRFSDQMEQRTKNYKESLLDMLVSHQKKANDLKSQIKKETDEFLTSNTDREKDYKDMVKEMTRDHNKKVEDIKEDIKDETAKGEEANKERLKDLKEKLREEVEEFNYTLNKKKVAYEEETKKAKEEHDKKISELKSSFEEERKILDEHKGMRAKILERMKETDIDRLKRQFKEEEKAYKEQHKDRLQQVKKEGQESGAAMGASFKEALQKEVKEATDQMAKELDVIASLPERKGFLNKAQDAFGAVFNDPVMFLRGVKIALSDFLAKAPTISGGGGGGGGGMANDFISRPGGGVQKFSNQDTVVGFKSGGPLEKVMGGVTINFNGDMSVRSDQDIQSLAQEISRVLGRQSELARIGVGR